MPNILLQSTREGILTLTLNRPDKRNALSAELIQDLDAAVAAALRDDQVHAIILTGNGTAFCSGLDLAEIDDAAVQPQRGDNTADRLYGLLDRIYRAPKPTIAAVNGFAVAGGAGLMSVCDVVVASELARIGYPEIQRGLVAAVVMPYLLRQVGERCARYLLMTGELIPACEARAIGLVNEVVTSADLLTRATHVAKVFAAYPKAALALTKQWLFEAQCLDYDQQRELSRKLQASAPTVGDAGQARTPPPRPT